jgi:hypothetical protein
MDAGSLVFWAKKGRDIALRCPVGAARRPYHKTSLRGGLDFEF